METYCAKLMEYEKYLIANSLVPNGKAGYYVNWVDKFLHGINYREEGVNQSSFISFVNLMQKDIRYADWQVKAGQIKKANLQANLNFAFELAKFTERPMFRGGCLENRG